MNEESDLIGVKMALGAIALVVLSVLSFFVAPVLGVVISIASVSIALYFGYRFIQSQETDN